MDETVMKIIGDVDLSQISQDDFKQDVDLRVAVVREGNVLGSSILKPSESKERRLHF